jgi:L-alanine-DL-glutamate epimerase-like enolase superfamily enzyme
LWDPHPSDWARDVAEGMWGALRLDVTHSRTLAHAQRIIRLAESVGLPCEIQSFGFALSQYANLQLMLATTACRFVEVAYPREELEDRICEAPALRNGHVEPPVAAGLGHGVQPNELVEHCRLIARA